MKKEELKKEFIKWCDEPMSSNKKDREEMFEKIWRAGEKEIGIDYRLEPILTQKKDI